MSISFSEKLRGFRYVWLLALLIAPLLPIPAGHEGPTVVPLGIGTAHADRDTLVISRGKLHRRAEGGAAETLIVDRDDTGDIDISIGDRRKIRIDGDHEGDMVLMGDDIFVGADEVVDGNVVAVGGSVTVQGKVLGDVVAVGGSVSLGDSAVVTGDAVSVGGGVEKKSGARVAGETVNVGVTLPILPFAKSRPANALLNFVRWIIFYMIVFAAAALSIYLARDRIGHASTYLGREPFPSFLLGVLSPALALIAFVLLCITLIGIPVALALIFLYPVFLFLGWVVAGHRIGSSVNGDPTVNVRTVFTGLVAISGLQMFGVLLKLFGVGGIPILLTQAAGFVLSFTAALVGLGAILGTRFRRPPDLASHVAYPPQPVPGAPVSVAPAASPYAPPSASGIATPPPDAARQG